MTWWIPGILAAALLFRVFSLSGAGRAADGWLAGRGSDPEFIRAVLRAELAGLPQGNGLADRPAPASALVAAYDAWLLSLSGSSAAPPAEEGVLPPPPPDTQAFSPDDGDPPLFAPVIPPASLTPEALPATAAVSPAAPLPDGVQEITFDPKDGSGYDGADGVWIKNETSLEVDGAALLKAPPAIPLAESGPQIFIVHTHGSEAYWPDEQYPYTPTDVERTEDTRFNVVRVGDEMQAVFESMGLRVLHDRNIYDQPTYSGSYGRSLDAITRALREHPGISVIIDLHRDSIQTDDGTNYKTVVQTDGQKMAQAMLVIGTNDSGLDHPNWKQNLAFAMQLQKRANEAYPGLMRPINLRRERFNGHATSGAVLLEVGSAANTLGEAIETARRMAAVMGDCVLGR